MEGSLDDSLNSSLNNSEKIESKEDIEHFQPHKDKLRDFITQQLALILGSRSAWQDASKAASLALKIEEAVHNRYPDDHQKYRGQYQRLKFNLRDKKNDEFWWKIWKETLSASELAGMDSLGMAPQEKKQEREQIHHDSLEGCILHENDM